MNKVALSSDNPSSIFFCSFFVEKKLIETVKPEHLTIAHFRKKVVSIVSEWGERVCDIARNVTKYGTILEM